MPADVINVDFASLRAAADSLSVKAKGLEATMASLQQSLAPIKETWYASGSSAGQAAELSETRLRGAIADITAVIALFSVNDPIGRSNFAWRGFTLDWPPHASETRPWRQSVPRGPRADRLQIEGVAEALHVSKRSIQARAAVLEKHARRQPG